MEDDAASPAGRSYNRVVHEAPLTPVYLADVLSRTVVGQRQAIDEMAIALAKKLAGLPAGNVLLIGSSGTGKTTLMRAVEDWLAGRPDLAHRSTQIRIHANVLAQEAGDGQKAAVEIVVGIGEVDIGVQDLRRPGGLALRERQGTAQQPQGWRNHDSPLHT